MRTITLKATHLAILNGVYSSVGSLTIFSVKTGVILLWQVSVQAPLITFKSFLACLGSRQNQGKAPVVLTLKYFLVLGTHKQLLLYLTNHLFLVQFPGNSSIHFLFRRVAITIMISLEFCTASNVIYLFPSIMCPLIWRACGKIALWCTTLKGLEKLSNRSCEEGKFLIDYRM